MSGDGHVTNSAVLEFLSGLSGLSVSRCTHSPDTTVFTCEVTDGMLTGELVIVSDILYISICLLCPIGHKFSLTLDSLAGEFTYQPILSSPSVPAGSVLADITCFPDYMQSRFLLNLLNTTFTHPDP